MPGETQRPAEVKGAQMGGLDQNNHPKSYTAERCHCPAPAKGPSRPRGLPEEMPYLEVAHHGEAGGADPASGQPQGVEEGWPKALQEVGVAQQPHQDDCRRKTQPRRTPPPTAPRHPPLPPPGGKRHRVPCSRPRSPGSGHLPMKEPRLQMRLKKQLSGGRVPHLLRGQGKAQGALSWGALGCGACPPPQDTLLCCPSGALRVVLTPGRPHAPTPQLLT